MQCLNCGTCSHRLWLGVKMLVCWSDTVAVCLSDLISRQTIANLFMFLELWQTRHHFRSFACRRPTQNLINLPSVKSLSMAAISLEFYQQLRKMTGIQLDEDYFCPNFAAVCVCARARLSARARAASWFTTVPSSASRSCLWSICWSGGRACCRSCM